MLHQMTAGVVGDHRVRHAVMAEFPGGQRSTLIAGPGLSPPRRGREYPDHAPDRSERSPCPIDGSKPAGVTMGQDIDGLARLFTRGLIVSISFRPCWPISRLIATSSSGDFRGAGIGDLRAALGGGNGPSTRTISSSAHFRLIAVGRVAISNL